METENNTTEKPKKLTDKEHVQLFMQYPFQQIICPQPNGSIIKGANAGVFLTIANDAVVLLKDFGARHEQLLQFSQIEVKPLEKISDEDKKVIDKIEDVNDPYSPAHISYGSSWLETKYIGDSGDYVRFLLIESFQYLQEKGYALPYKNWSVEQLVEFGIYKLIE